MSPNITSEVILKEPLPDLQLTPYHTTSSALHPLKFVGPLEPWPNFEGSVQAAFDNHRERFRKVQLQQRPKGQPPAASLLHENVPVGAETGVQGRWLEHIGRDMNAVFIAQQIALKFSDFKACSTGYTRIPDVVCMETQNHQARIVGELKVPWVSDHQLFDDPLHGEERQKVLGQIARYMKDLNLAYGFMTTYNQTMFLHQVYDPVRGWKLQYSPVIHHDNSAADGDVTVRQCMWFLAQSVQVRYTSVNTTPDDLWVGAIRN